MNTQEFVDKWNSLPLGTTHEVVGTYFTFSKVASWQILNNEELFLYKSNLYDKTSINAIEDCIGRVKLSQVTDVR